MTAGFYLFIDEAGDEGIDRVRPIDPDGAPEYFVMCGVLVSGTRLQEANAQLLLIKNKIGMSPNDVLHFRDLRSDHKIAALEIIAASRMRLFAIVSNKRNMRKYRNARCEGTYYEIVNGRRRPKRYNWFYNHTFRYLMERVSSECIQYTAPNDSKPKKINVIFSLRQSHSYSQTRAYMHKLKLERRDKNYFNNKKQIEWPVVDPSLIDGKRAREEPLLQIADCVASAVYGAIDEDWLKHINPEYIEIISPRFACQASSPKGYGFSLLPTQFSAPLSPAQKRSLRAVGYRL